MAEITPVDITQAVIKQIPAFFNDTIDQLRDGEGAYLRDGMPEGVVGRIGQAVGRSACRQYAAQGPEAVGSKGERFERACRPYLDSLVPGRGAQFKTPFTGGQCDAKYNIEITGVALNANDTPLSPWQLRYTAFGPVGPLIIEQLESPLRFNIRQSLGSGITFSSTCTPNPVKSPGIRQISQSPVTGRFNGYTANITPCGVDNCGDPAPIVQQPRRIPDTSPPPFRFNPVPGIDIPINVELNPDGTINVDFGGGPETVDPFPGDEQPGGGGGGAGDGPSTPGTPGTPGDTGSGGTAEGEGEPGEELVGVLVEVLGTPENPNEFQNNAATVYRGIGYIRMGFPNRLGTDVSGGVVISPQFFHAQQRGLTAWQARANLGFNLRCTPFFRET